MKKLVFASMIILVASTSVFAGKRRGDGAIAINVGRDGVSVSTGRGYGRGNGGYGYGRGRDRNRYGAEKFQLYFNDEVFGRRGSYIEPIKLKQMLRQQYGITPRDYDLDRVRVVIKTKEGYGRRGHYHYPGTVKLIVGQNSSYAQTIHSYGDFRDNHRSSFDKIVINNPNYYGDSQGRWQLQMTGKVKLKKVVVFLKKKYNDYDYGRGRKPRRNRGYNY